MTFSNFRYISMDYLNKMSGGDLATKKLLLEMLIKELPEAIYEMKQLFAIQSWTALKNASHKMRSTLAFIGNNKMTRANNKILETLSQSENGKTLHQEIKQMDALGPKVLAELKKVYSEL